MKAVPARGFVFSLLIVAVAAYALLLPITARAAACQLPSTDYGSVTTTLTVPSTATYRLWSRVMVPDSTNNTYLLEIDGTTCYNVGGGSIPASTWTWVDYQGGNTSSKVEQSLAQGNHTVKLIGNKADVKLDRLIAVSDLSCVPNGLGDNCNVPDDTTPPTVSLTAPADGATVSGSVALSATATDNVAVTKVEFYDNSTLVATDTTAPYGTTWNTTTAPNGTHLLTARAYDAAGNIASDNRTVQLQNGDQQAPTMPTNVSATANAYNKVTISWTASTDNVGVAGYSIVRDGVALTSVSGVTSYQDTTVAPNTSYGYQVSAYDAAGNKSPLSAVVTVKTPIVPDAQAPTAPAGLIATAASSSQINLNWQASTDNIGVTGYDVYRGSTKLTTVTTTSFGDTGLQANTAYSYYVVARDAAGNLSTPSATVSVTTPVVQVTTTAVKGKVTDSRTGQPLSGVRVVVLLSSKNKLIYSTGIDGSYSFKLPAGGRYSISYSKRGYNSKSLSIIVDNGQTLTQDVALAKKR